VKVVVLNALGNAVACNCIRSLLATTPVDNFDVHVIRERGFRERTLNHALSVVGVDDDVLFVGDDIEFTKGWYEALTNSYDRADILGCSMLYPGSEKVQDRGYDLMQVDERITLEAKDRGLLRSDVVPFGFRHCDALCGCFMLVKPDVICLVGGFSEEGQNRWGEFIFACQARRHGATMGVIDHFLYHTGNSTKSNPDAKLSSVSYHMERGLWEQIVARHVQASNIKTRVCSVLEETFRTRLEDTNSRILVYGIGTVSEFLVRELLPNVGHVSFATGLVEEVGQQFAGRTVLSISETPLAEFDWILITPLYIGEDIYRQTVKPLLRGDSQARVSVVTMERLGSRHVYGDRDVNV